MIVACVMCRAQGLPSVQAEVEPHGDMGLLWTLCRLHREEVAAMRRAAEAWTARLRAAAERERRAQAARRA